MAKVKLEVVINQKARIDFHQFSLSQR